MKKFFVSLCAVALFAVSASAQFVNSTQGAGQSANHEKVWNTVSISYSPISATVMGMEAADLNALSVAWTQARSVLSTHPLYVEYGLGAQWSFMTNSVNSDYSTSKSSSHYLSLKAPVSVLYKFTFGDVALMPLAGLDLGCYVLGKEKAESTVSYAGQSETYTAETDVFAEGNYNRFIFNWHVGARVAYKKVFLGIGYEGPITSLQSDYKIKTSQFNISLGLTF